MQLTQQQLNYFDTFGYLAFPGLLKKEIGWITEEFEDVMANVASGKDHDGSARTVIIPTIDHSERLCTLLDDERVLGIAGALIGDDFNYGSGDGNLYSGNTHWHADGGYPELFAIKLAFYLDPLTGGSGSLRVIPGSHKAESMWRTAGLNANEAGELWGISPADVPGSVPLQTDAGDLVVFDHNLKHASFGGGKRRRMFTMNLHKRGKTPEEIERVDTYLQNHCPVAAGFKIGHMYTDIMLDTAGPGRLVHLEQAFERHAVVHPIDTVPRPFPGR
jgi:hypothetical protein